MPARNTVLVSPRRTGRMVDKDAMTKTTQIEWLGEPQKCDYRAAESYLSLTLGPEGARDAGQELERAEISGFPARDILWASGLSSLGGTKDEDEGNQAKVSLDEKLSPLLLFIDRLNCKLIIADGYRRLRAAYECDEDAVIPCKLV